ncbi:MAG: manganese efflux pump [Bacillota bacterium]|nr:manganese efflux pump [Bacillota bacterium]
MIDQWLTIILVSIVLGVDAFSLSLGMGIKGVSRKYEIRFSVLVGLFHVIMPLLGLYLGLSAGRFLGVWAGRLGAVILVYIGADMLRKAYATTRQKKYSFKEARQVLDEQTVVQEKVTSMLLLVTSVSMDALTIGFSLGTFQTAIYYSVLLMGTVAGTMAFVGFRGGQVFSRMVGISAQFAGGIILLGLAIKIII